MVNSMVIDGRRRRLGVQKTQHIEDYKNDVSLSSLLHSNDSDNLMLEHKQYASRTLLFDEVTKLSNSECSISTSLQTENKGWETASGVMFTIQPLKEAIELLTLEFPTLGDYGNESQLAVGKVQIYYRMGHFSGVTNDPSAWTLLADTSARLIPPLPTSGTSNLKDIDSGAIIPANEFKSTFLKAGHVYSIYISSSEQEASPNQNETLLKVHPSDRLVGEISAEDGSLQVLTGVSFAGKSFPTAFKEPVDFNGALHYRVTKPCNDSSMILTTTIVLEFAVNKDPNGQVMGSLRTAVDETLSAWFSSNEKLMRYSNEEMLKLEGIVANFKGQSEEKCPVDFDNCALVSTTLSFKHSHNLDHGRLEMEILGQGEQLNANVQSLMSPVETEYVRQKLSKAEFAISLTGVPGGKEMNDVQKRYFEEVTVNFLRKSIESKVFAAIVTDEIPETLFIEDGESPGRRTIRRNLFSLFDSTASTAEIGIPMLRGRRKLQTNSSGDRIQIITEIAAEGSVRELRNTVLEGIGNNSLEYTRELINLQMRPLRINEKEYGDFFANLSNVQVKPHVKKVDTGSSQGGEIGFTPPVDSGGGFVWIIICIVLIIFSLLWIFYRIYMDCFYSPYQKPIKLNNGKDEFKDEDESLKRGAKSSIFTRMFQGFRRSDMTPLDVSDFSKESESFLCDSKSFGSNTKNRAPLTRTRSSPDLTTATKPRNTLKPPSRKPSFDTISNSTHSRESLGRSNKSHGGPMRTKSKDRSRRSETSSSYDGFDYAYCSSGDEESSDEESITKSYPKGPRRGRLTATRSMPVQKRNQRDSGNDMKNQRKTPVKTFSSEKLRKSGTHRPPSGLSPGKLAPSKSMPKRGKLTPSKSMPVQKPDRGGPGKQREKPQRLSSHRTPSAPKRGNLTPSKSMPMQKRDQIGRNNKQEFGKNSDTKTKEKKSNATKRGSNHSRNSRNRSSKTGPEKVGVRRTKSMPIDKKKKQNLKKESLSSSPEKAKKKTQESKLAKKKELQDNQKSKLAKKKELQEKNSKNSDHSTPKSVKRKSEKSSPSSDSNKNKTMERKRGIRASKSMPIQKERVKPKTNSRFMPFSDMVHDSESDSDSVDSNVLKRENKSDVSPSTNSAPTKSDFTPKPIQRRASSSLRQRDTPKKSKEARKSYGKAGRIQYGGTSKLDEIVK